MKRFLISLLILVYLEFSLIGAPTSRIDNSNKENFDYKYQLENICTETYKYNDHYTVHYTYYKVYDEVIMTILCDDKVYNEKDVEFCIYTAEKHFIENKEHRYYDYSEIDRKTEFNKKESDYVVTTVRLRLYK